MRITLVVAVARNGIIGEHGSLPWRLPSELKRFKEITLGHPCVMGRKTFEGVIAALGKPLPGRDNIVVTRNAAFAYRDVEVVGSIAAALALGRVRAEARGVDDVMVIGGGEVYAATLPLADRIYLTRVEAEVDGDTHFPELDAADWIEAAREAHRAGPRDTADFTIVTLDRRRR
jgi:dihydrofolate reductase